jgi:hypothetical protein
MAYILIFRIPTLWRRKSKWYEAFTHTHKTPYLPSYKMTLLHYLQFFWKTVVQNMLNFVCDCKATSSFWFQTFAVFFECHMFSFGLFFGVWSLIANVLEHSVCSIFIGKWVRSTSYPLAYVLRCMEFNCQHFGKLCLFHLHRRVSRSTSYAGEHMTTSNFSDNILGGGEKGNIVLYSGKLVKWHWKFEQIFFLDGSKLHSFQNHNQRFRMF